MRRRPRPLGLLLGAAVAAVLVLATGQAGAAARTATASVRLTGSGTLSGVSTATWTGTNTQKLTTTTAPGTPAGTALVVRARAAGPVLVQSAPTAVRAVPGSVYSGSLLVSAAAVPATVRPVLRWYDAAGALLAEEVAGAPVADPVGWYGRVTVAGLAPARAAYVSLGLRLVAALAGETHYLSSPALTGTAVRPPAVVGPLRTVGNAVVDGNGRPVVLRGVDRPGHYDTAGAADLSRADVGRMAAWGATAVRITLAEADWVPGCASYDPGTPGIVDDVVSWVNAAGMVAVLDLQWTGPTCATQGLNPMPDAGSRTFWQSVAARYAGRPLVAFDLFNEPRDVPDDVWRDGGPARTPSGVAYQAVGMAELYATVRATGADNLVLLTGNDAGSRWPTTAPLAGTRDVVYAVHAYNCDTPATCTFGTGSAWLLDRFVEPGRTVPIMVTEFGWPSVGTREGAAFTSGVIAQAEQHGWGWLAWQWPSAGRCADDSWWSVVGGGRCSAGDTYEPSPAGMPVLEGLQHP